MSRTSISFTTPNDKWLQSQIESEEFNSKSEVVNDLIRKARFQHEEIENIRAKLIASEKVVLLLLIGSKFLKNLRMGCREMGNYKLTEVTQ